MERTGAAEDANLGASTGKYIYGYTPTNCARKSAKGWGGIPLKPKPLGLGAVTAFLNEQP